jgi:hypothetical protein
MKIAGTLIGAVLSEIPYLWIFRIVTCWIPFMIRSTIREPIIPDWYEPYSLFITGEMNAN